MKIRTPRTVASAFVVALLAGAFYARAPGLVPQARNELRDAGLDRDVGQLNSLKMPPSPNRCAWLEKAKLSY